MEFMPNIPNLSYKIEDLEKTFEGSEIVAVEKGKVPNGYDVTFEKVTFSYEQINVIDQVSFTACTNSTTAIVGESGSGKSTLAKLLVHYWDVDFGSIKIGEVDIRDFSMDSLMDMVSYVSQDTFLFNIPIIDNIRIGKSGASDEDVYKAAKAAQCHEFIVELADGYQSMPGDSGNKLSGGEKQRITIARAILKNAPIVVLDEATSSTDAENEDKIQEALGSLISGRTLIVIAHHLSTIVNSDKVVVLKKGKLHSEGTHTELMKSSEEYRQLWNVSLASAHWDLNVKEVENAEYSEKNYSTV
jgi:ATP-binding cassette subfamily B protein